MRTQAGFVTLAALLIILIITTTAALLFTSLFGEIQGESGYNQATNALAVAEAGVHWAGNKLGGAGAPSYAGDSNQTVQGAGGQQVGMFDVIVTCADGSSVSAGWCKTQSAARLITSTGYTPSKTPALGLRKVQMQVTQITLPPTIAVCGYNSVALQPSTVTSGNVGSEGSANPDMIFQSGAIVQAGGGQSGSVFTVTSPNCGACTGQVAGTVNPSQAPGSICPDRTTVVNSFTCAPGTTDWPGGDLTINGSNNSWHNITMNSNTLTFDTTGRSSPLVVQVNNLIATGPGNTVVIKGGGVVKLIVNNQMFFGPSSVFGLDFASGTLVPASSMVVESCGTGTILSGTPAVLFNPGSQLVSGFFIAPNGDVQTNPSSGSQGAVLALDIQFNPGTNFAYDPSVQNVGLSLAFNKLVSWQDIP